MLEFVFRAGHIHDGAMILTGVQQLKGVPTLASSASSLVDSYQREGMDDQLCLSAPPIKPTH
jgi:hypothetical protein